MLAAKVTSKLLNHLSSVLGKPFEPGKLLIIYILIVTVDNNLYACSMISLATKWHTFLVAIQSALELTKEAGA